MLSLYSFFRSRCRLIEFGHHHWKIRIPAIFNLLIDGAVSLHTGSLCRVYRSSWILRLFYLSDNFCMFSFMSLSIHSICSFVILFHCPWSVCLFWCWTSLFFYYFFFDLVEGSLPTNPPSNKCHVKSSQDHPLSNSEIWLRYTCSIII